MFSGLLSKPRFLEADLEDWCFEAWAWLMCNLGGVARIVETPWVLPTRDFFPPTQAQGRERAEHMFECIKVHMGMADWPCSLQAYERVKYNHRVAEHATVHSPLQPDGLFEHDGAQATVRYAEDLISQPVMLASTFAHELSHYLLAGVESPPPGGEDGEELVTELCVAYTGFGLFGGATGLAFTAGADSHSQYWGLRGHGYLSERTWALAMALFGALKGEPAPEKHMNASLKKAVRAAEKHLTKRPDKMAQLRAIV